MIMTPAAMCIALAVYFEARGEPVKGQYAVAEVILNRVDSPRYPNTACAVTAQDNGPAAHDCQFSYMCDGVPETPHEAAAWERAQQIAIDVSDESTMYVEGATHFAANTVNNRWTRQFELIDTIGSHTFYKE